MKCTFVNNTALIGGGLEYGAPAASFIAGTTFVSNTADQFGGGIFSFNGKGRLSIDDSTFNGNTAAGAETGNAINNRAGIVEVRRSTVTNNNGGASNAGIVSRGEATVTLSSTILADNAPVNLASYEGGTLTSQGYNLVSDSSLTPATGDLLNTPANLGPLQNNGGPTLTRGPLVGSAAVDAGDPAILFNAAEFDQRGPGFPRVSGTRIDIGAVERRNPTGETPDDPTPAAANTRVFLPFVRR